MLSLLPCLQLQLPPGVVVEVVGVGGAQASLEGVEEFARGDITAWMWKVCEYVPGSI